MDWPKAHQKEQVDEEFYIFFWVSELGILYSEADWRMLLLVFFGERGDDLMSNMGGYNEAYVV